MVISVAGEWVPRHQALGHFGLYLHRINGDGQASALLSQCPRHQQPKRYPQPFQVQWEGQQPRGKQDGLSDTQLGIQLTSPTPTWLHSEDGGTWATQTMGNSTRVIIGFEYTEQLNTFWEERPQEHLFLNGEWIWGNLIQRYSADGEDNELKSAAGSNWGEPTWLSRFDAGTSAEWMPGTKWRGWPREDRALGAYGLQAELFHPEH